MTIASLSTVTRNLILILISICSALGFAFKTYDMLEDNIADISKLKQENEKLESEVDYNVQQISYIKSNYMKQSFGLRDFDIVKKDIDTINKNIYNMNTNLSFYADRLTATETNLKILLNINKLEK